MAMSDGRDFDEELRGAMRAEADRAQPDPSSWSRVEARRAGRRSGGAWRWGALAVAVAAAIVLVAVLVWPRDDGDEVITVDSSAVTTTVLPDVTVAPTTEPVITTVPPTTEAPTTTAAATTTSVPAAGHPTTAVAVTEDGRLVVLDTSGPSAVEVRELDRGPDPNVVPEEGETAFLADPALSPDGSTVYYSLCCEPVVGVLFSAAVDGSSPPVNLGYGTFPTVSPSGDRLAIVQYDAIVVRDLATGAEQKFPDTEHQGTLIDLAWGSDEQSLLYVRSPQTADSELVRLDLASGTAEVLATTPELFRFPAEENGAGSVVKQCCADGFAEDLPVAIVGLDGTTVRENLPTPLRDRRVRGAFELRVDMDGLLSWTEVDMTTGALVDQASLGDGPYLEAAW
jgi:hypothetical protein